VDNLYKAMYKILKKNDGLKIFWKVVCQNYDHEHFERRLNLGSVSLHSVCGHKYFRLLFTNLKLNVTVKSQVRSLFRRSWV
jgi:hypothetical protein